MARKKRVKKVSTTVTWGEASYLFLAAHWRGVLLLIAPLVFSSVVLPFPGEAPNWVGYSLLVMACFWVSECIPVVITGLIPIVIFPIANVLPTRTVCHAYTNDTIMMFLGSLMLAKCVDQSGAHRRLVYFAVRHIGYSHYKLLMAMCIVTTFVSLWITNTATTTMMVPINFALLNVFEEQGVLKVYEKNADGELEASDMTTCYFCAATFAASIGGIGTLIATGTNLVFKGLFMAEFPNAPEYLSFPLFSAFSIPYMILMTTCLYMYLIIVYFGVFRPGSPEALRSHIPEEAKKAAQIRINKHAKALGAVTFHEYMVVFLFGSTMVLFFCRSPQIFPGWADVLQEYFDVHNEKYILDSALCLFAMFCMTALPSNLNFFRHFTRTYVPDMPKGSIMSVVNWEKCNREMPYSFMFLLGGGFALSAGAGASGLNDKIGDVMQAFSIFPLYLLILVIIMTVMFITSFASNVAVATVLVPIVMDLAKKIGYNPLWFVCIVGYCCSFCFLLPVSTPGNLIVQSAASIPVRKMMKAGAGPTVTTIIVSWFAFMWWCPVIWPDVLIAKPSWL